MKKEIPNSLVFALIAIVVIGVGLFLWRGTGGSGDPSRPLATDYQGEPGGDRKAAETQSQP